MPWIVGGVVGYAIARSTPPVVYTSPPVVYNNGTPVYNLPQPPVYNATPIYERRTQWDPNCNCYVVVYNQIGWQ